MGCSTNLKSRPIQSYMGFDTSLLAGGPRAKDEGLLLKSAHVIFELGLLDLSYRKELSLSF